MVTEYSKPSREAEGQGVRRVGEMERARSCWSRSPGKESRPYVEDSEKLLKYFKQESCMVSSAF